MSTLNIEQQQVLTCPATGYQLSSVCVPVTVTPFAIPGTTETICCGSPVITPGIGECPGLVNGNCMFTITQNLCTAVPIEFGANATTGNPSVVCGTVSSTDICTTCGAV
ncbi:MAG TPA: hypothetical protein VFC96_00090 [Anaerovoracaceae bacterium]|nr:hypothetical protein [Anaerovoracaceae bacterium]